MAYTITDVKNDIAGILHGTTANQITNFYGLLFRAASTILQDIDPEETRRTAMLSPIFGQTAYDYAAPSDLKGNRMIDLRPQVSRTPSNVPTQLDSQNFDIAKAFPLMGSLVEVRNDNKVKTLRISMSPKLATLLNDCDSLTSNGTWSTTGLATGLEQDNIYYVTDSSSLKYSLTGNGGLVNSTMTAMDLTDYQSQGTLFVWCFLEAASLPTMQTLKWGSSASDYYSNVATEQFDGTAFQQGWNLLGFDWSDATTTGSPDVTAIDYLSFTTIQPAAATPVRLDDISIALPSIYNLEYYSRFLFRNSAGTFQEKPTADSDMINLDTDSYMVFLNKAAMLCAQQQQGKDTGLDMGFFEKEYEKALMKYYRKYPSQAQKTVGSYYRVKRSSFASKYGSTGLLP